MKKRILFVNYSLHSGGVEKSLVTLLSLFDYEKYDVDLQLFVNEGMFLSRVPEKVNLLPPLFPEEFRMNIRQAFLSLLKQGKFATAFRRLRVSIAGKGGTVGERYAKMWNVERHFIKPAEQEYDTVIAFMEGQPIYYAATMVRAENKIGFIHGDYIAMGLDSEFDHPYIEKLDALCTVSESCRTAFVQAFPEFEQKFHVIYNIISAPLMREMAAEPCEWGDAYQGPRVLTIARLSKQKGLDLALPAVAKLKEKGLAFKWYIIGVGPEEAALKEVIGRLQLEGCVSFLYEQANPYPFLKNCTVYLQPSRFEGKSIAVDEAMVLCRPILLTDFSTAADQIDSGKNGLIVPMTPEGIAEGLERLLTDGKIREAYSKELSLHDFTNEDEIQKLYALIDRK